MTSASLYICLSNKLDWYISILYSFSENESTSKNKTKRVRTTFTEEQIQVLQANFQLDSNPDGQDLERIAQITGLSKRVTQVMMKTSVISLGQQGARKGKKKFKVLKVTIKKTPPNSLSFPFTTTWLYSKRKTLYERSLGLFHAIKGLAIMISK